MVPMRSVPHRVVCLLGLDDGVFPRSAGVDGDDIIARDPAVGERDPRGEDRQLMLDAVLAATEHLVITYSGADERTGARRPPAVPLGELLDTLDDTARTPDGEPARSRVLRRHPLQPFDARNMLPGELGTGGPFSFDPAALAGARAAAAEPVATPPFLPAPLPAREAGDVELTDLTGLLVQPARGFLRQRLGVGIPFEQDEPSDSLTVDLDALEKWKLGDRMLRDRLAGVDEKTCQGAEWRRGTLPPGSSMRCWPRFARWSTARRTCARPEPARSTCWPSWPAVVSCAAACRVCTGRCWSRSATAGWVRRTGCGAGSHYLP
jgi:exodeoxyribonuclease V gamma subunit